MLLIMVSLGNEIYTYQKKKKGKENKGSEINLTARLRSHPHPEGRGLLAFLDKKLIDLHSVLRKKRL